MRCVGLLIVWACFAPGALFGQALFSAEVRLVEVHATVLERGKRYVSGLGADSFEVLDEGEVQPLTVFEADSSNLACAIVLDATGSMKRSLPVVKNAVAAFIDDFRGSDLVSVYAFSSNLRQLQGFTGDKQLAKRAVFATTAYGETALFNSASQVISDLEQVHGKRALLLFTDGDDNASAINAGAVIMQARRAGVPIYAVASGAAAATK